MCRRKIENRDQLLADVDEYIRDHSQVSLEELVQSMQELGHDCTPRMVRPLLKERGLKVKSVNGRWFWGVWDDDESDEVDEVDVDEDDVDEDDDDEVDDDEVDDDEEEEERPVPEPLKKAQAENKRLQEENRRLIAALLKTTQLKKSIQAMQKKLLVELADLIHATYGERESESETQESD